MKKRLLNKEIKKVILIVLMVKILIWSTGLVGWNFLPSEKLPWNPNFYTNNIFIQLWTRWDGGWYLIIAKIGYVWPNNSILPYGFFPLYPFLIKALSYLIKDFALSGFLISNIMTFVAAIYLFKLAKLENNKNSAIKSVLYFMLFPMSFFLTAVYSEALFIALTIATFYYARKGDWLKSSILGCLSSMTSIVGVLAFIPLVYEYFKQNKVNKKFLFLFLIPLGAVLVSLYFWFLSGDLLAFMHAEASNEWKTNFSLPLTAFVNDFKPIIEGTADLNYTFVMGMNYVFLAFLIVLFLYSVKHLRKTYSIFIFLNLLLFFSLSTLESFMRYIMAIFPIYLLLGKIGTKNKIINSIILLSFLVLLEIFTIIFTNGYWIT